MKMYNWIDEVSCKNEEKQWNKQINHIKLQLKQKVYLKNCYDAFESLSE